MGGEREEMEGNMPADRVIIYSKRSQQQSGRQKEEMQHSSYHLSCQVREIVKTCRKSSQIVWESMIWDLLLDTCSKHLCLTFDRVSHSWPGNALNTLQENWSLFSLANILLQQEEDHLPGRAELSSLPDLDWPEGKTTNHNLSHTQTHTENIQRIWLKYWKRLKLLLFNKNLHL